MTRPHGLLLLAAIAVAAGTYYWLMQLQLRNRLTWQLLEQQQVLALENSQASTRAEGIVKNIEAKVKKNQSQPREVAILQRCRALRQQTAALLDTHQRYQSLVLRQAGFGPSLVPGPDTGTASQLVEPVENTRISDRALVQHFAAYQASLPALPADSLRVIAPVLSHQPAVVALAAIAQAESDLLAAEQRSLQDFGRRVGAVNFKKNFIAVASAESNVVRPGHIYHARLYVLKQLALPAGHLLMRCNGQPVAVDEHGIGRVRFRAPSRPGPAVWHGAIRYNINGRDTTFQLTMPYRVGRP